MSSLIVPLSMLAGVTRFGTESAGWTLDAPSSESERTFVGQVTFERAFVTPPVVHLGLVGFDISEHDCARLRVRAVDITPEGFSVHVATWFGSRVWSVDVSWVALGTS